MTHSFVLFHFLLPYFFPLQRLCTHHFGTTDTRQKLELHIIEKRMATRLFTEHPPAYSLIIVHSLRAVTMAFVFFSDLRKELKSHFFFQINEKMKLYGAIICVRQAKVGVCCVSCLCYVP